MATPKPKKLTRAEATAQGYIIVTPGFVQTVANQLPGKKVISADELAPDE